MDCVGCQRTVEALIRKGSLRCWPCGSKLGAAPDRFSAFSVVENGAPMEVMQYPTPTPTGNEVLIRTTYAGMCHSDVHIWEGFFDFGGGRKAPAKKASRDSPFTLGHEFEGVIVAAGETVPLDQFDMAKSYAVFPWLGCDRPEECAQCAAGNMNWCTSPKTLKFTDGASVYGGYASYCLIPHYKYLMDYEGAVPTGLGGVMMCSGLTAFSALECAYTSRNPPRTPDDLVILGCGGLGFQGLSMACAKNGAPPIVADISEEKLEAAAALGCKTFNPAKKESAKEILKISNGGVAAVIDFVGNEKSHAFAKSIVRSGGKVVIIGLLGGKMESPLPMFVFRSLTIEGSMVGNMRQAKDMLDLCRTGKVPVVPHQFRSIFEVNSAFKDLSEGKIVGRCILKHDWSGPEASKL